MEDCSGLIFFVIRYFNSLLSSFLINIKLIYRSLSKNIKMVNLAKNKFLVSAKLQLVSFSEAAVGKLLSCDRVNLIPEDHLNIFFFIF